MNSLNSIKKYFKLFTKKQKSNFLYIIIFGIICSIIEVLSLLILNPTFQILLKNKNIKEYFFYFNFNILSQKYIENNIIIFALLFIFSIFIIKLILSYLYNWVQSSFVANFENSFTSTLYKSFITKDYMYFINHNSSNFISKLTYDVDLIISSINAILILILELAILLGAFIALLILNFYGTLIISLFLFISIALFNFFQKRLLSNLSYKRYNYINEKHKLYNQSFKNIKDVKIFGIEQFLLDNFQKIIIKDTLLKKKISFIGILPRNFLEIIILISISLLFFYFSIFYDNFLNIIPIFSVYLLSLFRILPSLNKILVSVQQIKNSSHVINENYSLFNNNYYYSNKLLHNNDLDLFFSKNIEIRDLFYKYDEHQNFIFKNVNLSINKGMKIGIIGNSGAGKTTFIDIILGLLKPTSGSILVDGIDIQTNLRNWQYKIGYVQQSILLSDTSIKDNIAYGILENEYDENILNQVISYSNLDTFIKNLPNGINTIIGENGIKLSGGQRQRIAIARALYRKPEILIFDEATSALDQTNEDEIISSIYSLNYECTMIIVSHKLSMLNKCDIIYIINNNEIEKFNT
jgi:ATP-binding cassette, subfamily B, bacterial PglK